MKTKIKLTDEQINELVKVETEKLKKEYEQKLAALKGKFEYAFIEVDEGGNEVVKKTKMTKELFLKEYGENPNVSAIGRKYGISAGYMSVLKKKYLNDTK
jgi:hypothetical protein